MTYFEDLAQEDGSGAKAVGWLSIEHAFPIAEPNEAMLDALWNHCRISVEQTRGWHRCEFCPPGNRAHWVKRKGERLALGSAEIRVFSPNGDVYRAPTLIYHYVKAHHYAPPAEVVDALLHGPAPPSADYFARLEALGLEWRKTGSPPRGLFRWLL